MEHFNEDDRSVQKTLESLPFSPMIQQISQLNDNKMDGCIHKSKKTNYKRFKF
jgi:hypothetical protein